MKLIVFFNGWGTKKFLKKINCSKKYEIMNIKYPYSLDKNILENYDDILFIGWSLGVYYLNKFLNENEYFQKYQSIAINGNPLIIGNYGISSSIYKKTIANLNKENLKHFYNNMGYLESYIYNEDIDSLKKELEYTLINYKELENCIKLYVIGTKDKIVPYTRQIKYCNKHDADYIILDMPHYIFDNTEVLNFIRRYI